VETVNRITSISIEDCAAAVSDVFDSIFETIDLWRLAVEHHAAGRDGRLTRAGIDDLIEGIVIPEFARQGSCVIGAGFVAAPGAIVDADWHLAWWLGDRNTFGMGSTVPHIRRLEAVEDPAAESFRDYTTLEWWRVPERTGRRHITGPYVDYLCTDEYTLTLTEPVIFRDESIGVVGADLYAEDLERALLPELRAAGSSVTLVNSSGRVLVSTDVHLATGSLLRFDGLASALRESAAPATRLPSGQDVVHCATSCFSLVVG
jgi:hypothetical protein